MNISFQCRSLLMLLLFPLIYSCSGNLSQTILFEDDFRRLPAGYISSSEGPFTEYHYVLGIGQSGPWQVSTFGWQSGFHTAWEIVQRENRSFLQHNYHAIDKNLDPLHPYFHSMIVAGDSIWHDYRVEFEFSPGALMDECGVVFKYVNDRSYCFFGMEGDRLMLKMVNNATAPHRPFERVLDAAYFPWKAGEVYRGNVSIRENRIYALMNDTVILVSEDNSFPRGKVGFLSDVPAEFYSMKVTTLKREKRKISRYEKQITGNRAMRISENPEPVVWKKLETPGFGAGRNLRFGELNGDGEMDLLIGQVIHHGPGDAYSELSCLTAMSFDGDVIWQKGTPDANNYKLTNDVAFQIHDLDDDGQREVVYTMNFRLYIADGKTGKIKASIPTPLAKTANHKYARILGDAIYFCDLSGKGRDSDILIKDRYWNVWAYNEKLEFLWSQSCKTGHYPYAYDIDNDGFDEVAIGYTLIDHNGEIIWNNDQTIGDHADAVAITSLLHPADSALKVIYAASDWGTMFLDTAGNILKHHPVGHVQNPAVANFRQDLPGLEMISVNFWGSQGIIHFYDALGNIYHSFEPGPYGSMCLPVNWRGDGVEYFVLNTNPGDGGMFNGEGRLAVSFPDDGHPDLCNAVLDITGDSRDEIVTWNQHEIWVYTQPDNNRQGRLYQPRRNPLYNYSNYQFTVSAPGWSN